MTVRPLRLFAGTATVLLVVAAWLWGPTLLRGMTWFEIQRVEVSGAALLTPREVLTAAGVRKGQNLWEDRAAWEDAVRAHPAVLSARVKRRVPGTLRIEIVEKRPVALVEDGTLRLATAAGELLPVDPSRQPLDLPIVRASWVDSTAVAAGRVLLAETARLERLDPALIGAVSEIRSEGEGARVLVLSHRYAEIVIPVGTDAARLAELRAVLADVRQRLGGAPAPRTPTVDLRYQGQVVVRHPSSV